MVIDEVANFTVGHLSASSTIPLCYLVHRTALFFHLFLAVSYMPTRIRRSLPVFM